jgi:hypothetical protein
MPTELHSLENLPEEAQSFWDEAIQRQDKISAFASGRSWFTLMSGENPDARVVVTHSDDAGTCRVLIPLMDRTWTLALSLLGKVLSRQELKVLKAGGGDLVENSADPGGLADAIRETLQRKPEAAALWFEHVADESRFEKLVSCARDAGCFRHILFRRLPHYRFILPATWDECRALRSSKSLGRIRSKENALARELDAPLELVELRRYDEWLTHRDRVESIVEQSWQAQLLGQGFKVEHVRGSAEAGHLRGFLLVAKGQPVAFTLYYAGEETMISGVLAYDRRYGKHSPGTVLFLRTLEYLYANDPPKYLDFGEGDAEYKRQWQNDEIAVNSILLVRNSFRLRALFLAFKCCNWIDRTTRSLLLSCGLDRVLVRRLKRD